MAQNLPLRNNIAPVKPPPLPQLPAPKPFVPTRTPHASIPGRYSDGTIMKAADAVKAIKVARPIIPKVKPTRY